MSLVASIEELTAEIAEVAEESIQDGREADDQRQVAGMLRGSAVVPIIPLRTLRSLRFDHSDRPERVPPLPAETVNVAEFTSM